MRHSLGTIAGFTYRRRMPERVAILRPPEDGIWHNARWPEVLRSLAEALEGEGLRVEDRSWLEPVEALARFDLILPLLVWGYHRDGDWQRQVAQWKAAALPLSNPAPVLAWNADKHYLQRFERAGARVVPTLFVPAVDERTLAESVRHFGTRRVIAKPTVSAGAFQTIRWSPGDPLEGAPSGAAMIQPYLETIETLGELSLIFFEGQFSHAVRKVPQPGDFRVQPEFDGILRLDVPAPSERAAAEAVLRAAGEPLLYARVDLVEGEGGEPLLMELELVEPDLFLRFDPGASSRFGSAVARAVRQAPHARSQDLGSVTG